VNHRNLIKLAVSVAIAGALLWVAARGVDGAALVRHLGRVDAFWMAAYFVIIVVIQVVRAWRWQLLLTPLKRLRFGRVFGVTSVGFAAIFLLPLRAGELVRPYLVAEDGIRMSAALGTVAVERVIDGVCVAGFMLVVIFAAFSGTPPPFIVHVTWLLCGVFGGALAFILVAHWRRRWVLAGADVCLRAFATVIDATLGRWSPRLGARLESLMARGAAWVLSVADSFIDGLNLLHSPWHVAGVTLSSLAYWGVNGLGQYLMFVAMGFHQAPYHLGVGAAYASMSVLVAALMLPTGPGFTGNFEWAFVTSLGAYGVDRDGALAYALLMHVVQMLAVVAVGAYFLVTGRVSFARALQAVRPGREDKASA
jgi:hypothetical protein